MGRTAMSATAIDYSDIQGIVRFGYKRMTEASYALVRVKSAAAARAWLQAAPVTPSTTSVPPPPTALQVAFTAAGLEMLGVSPAVLAAFSPEFLGGMADASRARRLGDVGINAPSNWEWGDAACLPHLLIMFFAEPGQLDRFVQGATGSGWNDAFDLVRWLHTANLDGIEPFGFADGISQPSIDWAQERDLSGARIDFSNVAALGEFLLGYRNEYGKYTDRPLVDLDAASAALPAAEDAPEKKDLARNGTYLVVRQLRQDVRAFWQFLWQQAGGNQEQADRLAATLVGRTMEGEPLVPVQTQAIPGIGTQADRSARISSPSTSIRGASPARSVRTCAARTRATPTIRDGRSASRAWCPRLDWDPTRFATT